jgi:nanoRNase/pAp phosphatase (c-di-AMP/oligoRNAs hydrolase)/predicted transcriptional regulator
MEIVTTHKNTDFDGCASVFAATLLYPHARPILPRSLNPNVKGFLSIHKDLFPYLHPSDIELADVSRLIVVDTNSWGRLETMDDFRDRSDLEIFLYDHHEGNGSITPNWSCREDTGATTTLLVDALKRRRKKLTPMQATLFLAGIYEDTGNLTFPGTTAADAYAAAYLLDRHADLGILETFLRPAYGEKQKDILFEMLRHAHRTQMNGYTLSIRQVPIHGHTDSLAVVVRMFMEILNVDAAFGIFHDPDRDRCLVIGRSRVEQLDVGAVMRSLGGGGHPGAGSAVLKSVVPEDIREQIAGMIEGNRRPAVQISDIMSFPVTTVTPATRMEETARLLREKGITGIPVADDGRLEGMISRRDFRRIKRESQLKSPVKAFMTTRLVTIPPGLGPLQAARLMVKHDIGRLPVVEDGRIIGIVTRSDVMTYYYDLLPD